MVGNERGLFFLQILNIGHLVSVSLKTNKDLIGIGIKTSSVLLSDINYINAGSDSSIFYQFFLLILKQVLPAAMNLWCKEIMGTLHSLWKKS